MVQEIENITKKLTKIINTKKLKEKEIEKIKQDMEKMNIEIVEMETKIINLIKNHQKTIKIPKRKTTSKVEETQEQKLVEEEEEPAEPAHNSIFS